MLADTNIEQDGEIISDYKNNRNSMGSINKTLVTAIGKSKVQSAFTQNLTGKNHNYGFLLNHEKITKILWDSFVSIILIFIVIWLPLQICC